MSVSPRRSGAAAAVLLSISLVIPVAVAALDAHPPAPPRPGADRFAADFAVVFARHTALEQVVHEVLAGELGLAPAAAEVELINRGREGFESGIADRFPAVPGTRARCARWLIEEVRGALDNDPSRQAAAVARLEAEYAALVPPRG